MRAAEYLVRGGGYSEGKERKEIDGLTEGTRQSDNFKSLRGDII